MDIGNLADIINDDAMKDLTTGIIIEPLNTPLVDNNETIKKIEEKRKYVSMVGQKGSGLGLGVSPKIIEQTANKPASSSTTNSSSSYGSSYGSGYSYGHSKPVETDATRAKAFSEKVINRSAKAIQEEIKESQGKNKKSLNIFELEEKKSVEKVRKKITPTEKRKIERKDGLKIAFIKALISVSKSVLETLYLKSK